MDDKLLLGGRRALNDGGSRPCQRRQPRQDEAGHHLSPLAQGQPVNADSLALGPVEKYGHQHRGARSPNENIFFFIYSVFFCPFLHGYLSNICPPQSTARALDLYDNLGSFTPGKEADFAGFDVNPASVPELGVRNTRFEALPINGNVTKLEAALFGMYNLCDDRCTVATYSGGRKLYDRVLGELNP